MYIYICGTKICFNLENLSFAQVSLALFMFYIFITLGSDVSTSIATFRWSIFFFFPFFFFVASDRIPLQLHGVTIRYGLMLLIVLTVVISAEKLVSGESSEHPIWKLTDPVPLDDDGSSMEAVLGKNPDIHYIYICTKVDSKFLILALSLPVSLITNENTCS